MKYEAAKKLIKDYEKCRLKAYKCQAGVWTIGWGTTRYPDGGFVSPIHEITQEYADECFDHHFEQMEKQVRTLLKFPDLLSENQMGAILSLVYNIGIGAFEKSTLLQKINQYSPLINDELYAFRTSTKERIAKEFPRWNKVKGKESKGLTRRREEEMNLFLA